MDYFLRQLQCCIRYIKDTILKAIYNNLPILLIIYLLYSVYQRYNFESNLQQEVKNSNTLGGCIRYIKDTILKAIYNDSLSEEDVNKAVFGISKIQF